MATVDIDLGAYQLGWSDPEDEYVFKPQKGLSEDIIRAMSAMKKEPEWMLQFRLKAYRRFLRKPIPQWGGGGKLDEIDFDDIYYYIKPTEGQAKDWDMVPDSIKETYEKLGIPQAERKFLAGVTAQYECLRGDVRVYTTSGLKPIKEVAPGEQVFSLDEETGELCVTTVKSAAQTGVRQTYRVSVGGRYRRTIHATNNHPLLTLADERRLGRRRGRYRRRWKTVAELEVGDLVAVARELPAPGSHGLESQEDAPHPFPARTSRELVPAHRVGISGDVERLGVRNPRRNSRLGKRSSHHGDTIGHNTDTTRTVGFARVTEIAAADVAPVYDIEIDGPHNFVAEGMVVHNSEVVYHRNREDLEGMGVLFCDMDTALREYPDIVKQYFGTIIPPNDNKFAALNSAVWSGGSFIYVPPGVHLEQPLQAYFRINAENMGQFERTLIIVDEGAYCHYVEGCSAPVYTSDSLHSAVVEVVIKEGARARYTTIQNWSNNVYNLVTKRAAAYRNATMEWIDGNIGCLAEGSRVTTRSGVKPIELVTPGEEVLSFDEMAGQVTWQRVAAKRFSGRQQVRRVRSGVRSLFVTDNHPFYSYRYDENRPKKLGRYRLGYVRADELAKAIVPTTSLDYGEPHKLEVPANVTSFVGANQYQSGFRSTRARAFRLVQHDETSDDLMWLFGLFLADGSIDAKVAANGGLRWAKVTFSVPADDRARPRLITVMDGLMPGVAPTERKDGVTVTWNSVELAELLTLNGFRTGAQHKDVPGWVLDIPESQRLSLIGGFLDGDGCAPHGSRGFAAKSVNKTLLEGIASVLTSLGISARLHTEFVEERQVAILDYTAVARGSHQLVFSADERVLRQVSPQLRDAALAQRPPKLRYFRRVGRSQIELSDDIEIRPVEVSDPGPIVPTWDIEVEGTGNFVAEGFIVHNSQLTMKYPAVWLMEPGAHGEVLSIAFAGKGQHQDAGAKMVHAAPDTTSLITSKSISKDGGRGGYRGLVRVEPGADRVKSFVRCDALILDEDSRSDTYPYMEIEESNAQIGHEATVSKVGEDQLFYLMSRGLSEQEATSMIVAGFIEPIVKELPMEYAVELNRLIELEMIGSVG